MFRNIVLGGEPGTFHGRDDDLYVQHLPAHARELDKLASVAKAVLPDDAIVMDIGANIGLTPVLLARHAAQVVALEPSPDNFSYLKRNLSENRVTNVLAHQVAASSSLGTISFHQAQFGAGSSQVDARHIAQNNTPSIVVPAVRVDDLVTELGLQRLDFVKIDVEGFEIDVLRGMEKTITGLRPTVFLEFNSWCMIAFRNLNPRELLDLILEQFEFVFWVAEGNCIRITPGTGPIAFLHENLVRHHCMTDVICTSSRSVAEKIEAIRFKPSAEEQLSRAAESVVDRAKRLLRRR
ncbi:FkbM family methyltransferase [Skermanella pratensis]|uniref:FkbM family methyltransferase n=1 Tax=Skermanella pratensis TaxID=2233999 RepID=UPI0013016707|nr:FkbM family methyltransferase [Skermanella pratensis]